MELLVLLCVCLAAAFAYAFTKWRRAARADFVRRYMFPPGLFDKLLARRPGLSVKEQQLVARALRQFFLAYLRGGRRRVAMPSQVVDDLWHEFILYTRNYERFCRNAFGGFLHHTPAVVRGGSREDDAGLRRVWWFSCLEENIDPRNPTRLPLLFAIDGKLGIENGFVYTLDCSNQPSTVSGGTQCTNALSNCGGGGSLVGGDTFGDSGGSWFGGGDSSGGDSGGCSGGCGGGGGD